MTKEQALILNGYEHPFDFVIETIKNVRQLKADAGIGNKPIKDVQIIITDSKWKVGAILTSLEDIKYMCKCERIFVSYDDRNDTKNSFTLCYIDSKFPEEFKMTKEQMQEALIINGWEPILPHKKHLWVTKTDGYKWAYSTEVAYHKMLNGKS